MNKKLKEKISEAFSSVMPITVIVLLISIFIAPVPIGTIMMFLVGAVLLIIGMGFFSLGADMAMMPMGEGIGAHFTKSKKLWLVVLLVLSMGILITIAEPDLQVLAKQVAAVPDSVLIGAIAIGVGVFLVIAILRILFQISLSKILIICYFLVFALSAFAPKNFIPVAFDSGGVTTGPITVPFMLALGVGVSSVRGDKRSMEDSFGLVALGSVGPILAVIVLSILYSSDNAAFAPFIVPEVATTRDVAHAFFEELPNYIKEVSLALVPIMLFFAAFQLAVRRYHKRELARIAVGFVYSWIGLVLFLTGVNVGFIPVGHYIGAELGGSATSWILIPIGMVIGYFIVTAEPAVYVLNKQVEEISGGAIPQSAMKLSLSIGVSVSLGLSILRVLTGTNIYWILIPGYAIAIALTFFVPKIFTGIAFDSGGVASGPMTTTFLLPFAMGACQAAGGDIMKDAFGIVAMVAMTPLIAIQLMGLIYGRKMKAAVVEETVDVPDVVEIVDYEEGLSDE